MTSAHQPLPPEEIVTLDDPETGLRGVIVLDSTRLGAAAGGCRLWRYPSQEDATADALRLARGMTYKNALAGLPFGGGKAVIREPAGPFDRVALFAAFGRAVERLGGRYVTAEDAGTSVADMTEVARHTRHVAGIAAQPGRPGGDPSPWTALGVFRAMEVAVARRLGTTLAGLTVGVQGLGHVGFALCEHLHQAGAKLVVAEPRSHVAARAAAQFGAQVMTSSALAEARMDVFAPCALGGVLDFGVVRNLRATVVCGAANNQLFGELQGRHLADRGILYAPDYLVNAGGIINVAAEYLGWDEGEVRQRVDQIGARLGEILDLADQRGLTPDEAADLVAQSRIRGDRADALAA
ncbi:leucine dehydrogenase [Sphingomonas laterariae]|uniref:Leucine dehydrogenase n=1 Tax=Edaphosphingomonas laterariae TaxID=861865 RepID=A0A239HZM2_9SPHN|nr:Glu/Leu/Phe/Val dehydrogenase dimerization domain-containing protein [Sphingomonas laterariae]SNS86528.1 leucine dehydrogenase [Sphingomonas laterariae]